MAVAEGTAGPQSHDASSGFRVLRVFVALGFKGCALTLNPKPLGYLGHVRAFKGAFRSEARCDEGTWSCATLYQDPELLLTVDGQNPALPIIRNIP